MKSNEEDIQINKGLFSEGHYDLSCKGFIEKGR